MQACMHNLEDARKAILSQAKGHHRSIVKVRESKKTMEPSGFEPETSTMLFSQGRHAKIARYQLRHSPFDAVRWNITNMIGKVTNRTATHRCCSAPLCHIEY